MAEVQLDTHLGRESVDVSSDKTLSASDCGIVQNVTSDGVTITLPATTVGHSYIVRNGGSGSNDGSVTVNVSPASADQIAGNGFTAADDKDAINTNGRAGDSLSLVADGVNGYFIQSVSGTWTREA